MDFRGISVRRVMILYNIQPKETRKSFSSWVERRAIILESRTRRRRRRSRS